MSEVCFVCGRRASRQCIADAGMTLAPGSGDDYTASYGSVSRPICSQCCGRGRRRTIDCPDACPHFRAGARAALFKLADLSRDPDFELRHGEVLHNLRLGVTLIRRKRLPELKDGEVRQAFANVADTMRTRSSGLIYDFRSPDPRVQMLYDELMSVATLHERGEKGMTKTDAATLMQCLKYLERQAATAEKQERGATFFLDLIAQCVSGEFATREQEGLVRGE
jgi:hypothetical protein